MKSWCLVSRDNREGREVLSGRFAYSSASACDRVPVYTSSPMERQSSFLHLQQWQRLLGWHVFLFCSSCNCSLSSFLSFFQMFSTEYQFIWVFSPLNQLLSWWGLSQAVSHTKKNLSKRCRQSGFIKLAYPQHISCHWFITRPCEKIHFTHYLCKRRPQVHWQFLQMLHPVSHPSTLKPWALCPLPSCELWGSATRAMDFL